MTQITLQMLKDMKPGIFATGEFLYDGGMKKWVATRGDIHDWAIYYGQPFKTDQQIKDWGTKLHEMPEVRKLVNCTDEALAMYRH
jgi:hypothetical protein